MFCTRSSKPDTACNGMGSIGVPRYEMRTLPHRGTPRQSRRAPVFADVSGRRRRRMRLLGLVAGGAMAAYLVVMAVGLLGGPRASLIPWDGLHADSSAAAGIGVPGEASSAPTQRAPDPSALPSPSTRPGAPHSTAASGSSSPAASASSSPTVTNRASRTPQGRNRSPSPHPSPSHPSPSRSAGAP